MGGNTVSPGAGAAAPVGEPSGKGGHLRGAAELARRIRMGAKPGPPSEARLPPFGPSQRRGKGIPGVPFFESKATKKGVGMRPVGTEQEAQPRSEAPEGG